MNCVVILHVEGFGADGFWDLPALRMVRFSGMVDVEQR